MQLKKKFPKNKLVKHLMASVWGMIIHPQKVNKSYDDIKKENLKIGEDYKILEMKHNV
jgi:hypothetical protein